VQVSYHVLSNAERSFGHALSQTLSFLSVKARVRSRASPYETDELTLGQVLLSTFICSCQYNSTNAGCYYSITWSL